MSPGEDRQNTGLVGEKIACEALHQRGYRIVARNWRSRPGICEGSASGEVDIIARDGDWWVFVEVKTRRSRSFGLPEEALTPTKAKRLAALAQTYLATHGIDGVNWRIDLIAIESESASFVTGQMADDLP